MKTCTMIMSIFAVTVPALLASGQTPDSNSPELKATINQIQMVTTPLVDAVNLIAEVGRVKIVIDRPALSSKHVDLSQTVTIKANNATIKDLLAKILPKSLAVAVSGQTVIVTTQSRLGTDVPFDLTDETSFIDSGKLAAAQALGRRMPFHFDHAPLEMVLQMVAGFAGKQLDFDGTARRQRFELVSIHRNDASLEEALSSVLQPYGLTYEIEGRSIVVKTRQSQ